MGNLFAWLLLAVVPLAKRVLIALGIGFLTYEGLTTMANQVVGAAVANWGQMTGAALQLCSLGGIPEMLGIICGAFVAKAALFAVGHLGKVAA